MSDVTWIKVTTNMFEDEKIRLIFAMPEGDTIYYVWMRLLVQAGKTNSNGFIFLDDDIPYTDEMLSTLFYKPLPSIRLALKALNSLRMIEIDEDNFIKISNWEKHQNVEGMEKVRIKNRDRAKKFRDKQRAIKSSNDNKLEEHSSDLENEDTEDICSDLEDNEFKNEEVVQNFDKHYSNITQKKRNVTENENNVTVTKQNKRENKNKKKNKNSIIDREKESNNSQSVSQEEKEDNNLIATELLNHYKKIIGNTGEFSVAAINLAISIHGKDYVRMAINKSIEVNKPNMTYINGILKNWKREGYPSEDSIADNKKYNPKNLKFNNFEPRQYDYDSLEKSLLGWDKDENSE